MIVSAARDCAPYHTKAANDILLEEISRCLSAGSLIFDLLRLWFKLRYAGIFACSQKCVELKYFGHLN